MLELLHKVPPLGTEVYILPPLLIKFPHSYTRESIFSFTTRKNFDICFSKIVSLLQFSVQYAKREFSSELGRENYKAPFKQYCFHFPSSTLREILKICWGRMCDHMNCTKPVGISLIAVKELAVLPS